jgi:RNA polymerase sigma factor (TIGR02999 family)
MAPPIPGPDLLEVTQILAEINRGDPQAAEKLLPLVYEELRRLAAQKLAQEAPGQTLQATALVHEAYVRLVATPQSATAPGVARGEPNWNSRGHFFAAAAEAMRRILINQARDKKRLKRGGGWKRIDLDHLAVADHASDDELIALDGALEQLALVDRQCVELIKLRFFAGLTQNEAAAALGLTTRTAARHWAYARAWLYEALRLHDPSDAGKE